MIRVDIAKLRELKQAAENAQKAYVSSNDGNPVTRFAAMQTTVSEYWDAAVEALPDLLDELEASRAVVEAARRARPLMLSGAARDEFDTALDALEKGVK